MTRIDREPLHLRAPAQARAERLGDTNSPADDTDSTFLLGECRTGCGDADRWKDNPREALKGLPIVVEQHDKSGNYLSTHVTSYTLRQLYTGLDGRGVSYAFANGTQSYLYDTAAGPASNPQLASLPVVSTETVGVSGNPTSVDPKDTMLSFEIRNPTNDAVLTTETTVDAFGNRIDTTDHGCAACGDEAITTHTAPFLVPNSTTGWLWRTQETWVEGDAHPGKRNDTSISYNEEGDPVSTSAVLTGTLPLQRTASTNPAPGQSTEGSIQLDSKSYTQLGTLAREVSPNARCRTVTYDEQYGQLPMVEAIHVGTQTDSSDPCTGALALTTAAAYDRGFARPGNVFDMNLQATYVRYDQFGRTVALYRPPANPLADPGVLPTVKIEYYLPDWSASPLDPPTKRYSAIHTMTQDGADPGVNSYLESWSFIDGMGRTVATLNEGEQTGNWIVNSLVDYDAKSAVRRKYLAYYLDFAGASGTSVPFPFTAAPASSYGRQRYDAFGRQLETFDLWNSPGLVDSALV